MERGFSFPAQFMQLFYIASFDKTKINYFSEIIPKFTSTRCWFSETSRCKTIVYIYYPIIWNTIVRVYAWFETVVYY